MKRKIIISSILAIAVCLCIIVGATLALFTSKNVINISVSSGNVKLIATIDDTSLKTWSLYDTHDDAHNQNGDFELGGSATINAEKTGITVVKMVPGDALQFSIDIANESDVKVKYRVRFVTTDLDTTDSVNIVDAFDWSVTTGTTELVADADNCTGWIELDALATVEDVEIFIELPASVGNEYQNKKADIAVIVEAIQGNANDADAEDAFN